MKNWYLWLQMKLSSYDVANTVCGKQKLSVCWSVKFQFVEWLFSVDILPSVKMTERSSLYPKSVQKVIGSFYLFP